MQSSRALCLSRLSLSPSPPSVPVCSPLVARRSRAVLAVEVDLSVLHLEIVPLETRTSNKKNKHTDTQLEPVSQPAIEPHRPRWPPCRWRASHLIFPFSLSLSSCLTDVPLGDDGSSHGVGLDLHQLAAERHAAAHPREETQQQEQHIPNLGCTQRNN